MRKMVFLGLFLVFAAPVSADELLPGDFANQSCIDCHEKQTPQPVLQWRASAHAPTVADCVACHGERHDGAAARSRRNDTCTGCHGGPESSVVRSYVTSKHGVIAAIEGDRWDWSRRLAEANYRAPTCAYCHLYDGRHDIGRAIAPWNPLYNGDAAAFLCAFNVVQGPHVMQSVGEFNQQHPNVFRHGEEKFPKIFRLLGIFGLEFYAGKLGHTID